MRNHISYRSGNPALTSSSFDSTIDNSTSQVMTLDGAVNKTILCLGLLLTSGIYSFRNYEIWMSLIWPLVIVGFIVALITIFKKTWSPVTAPIYAVVEGLALGAISMGFEKMFPGIAFQAIYLTCGIFLTLLFLYKFRIINATENFKLGLVAATGGIFLVYLTSFIMSFFGASIPIMNPLNGSIISIGFSLFVVVIAALNLVLDFDFIEEGAENGAPKYMEWYSAFGLMVTLVWLYLEILKLLSKLRSR
tara:strand:+ start:180 stop:926 length:747 start_codon:yes stop_codon:yes gene_type:complete